MIEKQCGICGKLMAFNNPSEVRKFCSRKCFTENKRRLYEKLDDGPPMLPLDKDSITMDGYVNLVKAIVERAGDDVRHFSPGTPLRVDAEKFFRSDFFAALTGLEGEPILRRLEDEYRKLQKRRKGANWK